jgi:hypothetical protein
MFNICRQDVPDKNEFYHQGIGGIFFLIFRFVSGSNSTDSGDVYLSKLIRRTYLFSFKPSKSYNCTSTQSYLETRFALFSCTSMRIWRPSGPTVFSELNDDF